MTLQHVYGATVVVLAFGVVTVDPAYAQRHDGNLLPQDQGGQVTAVGCLVRGSAVRGGKEKNYVLARPKKGPVSSVPDGACTTDPGDDALDLNDTSKVDKIDSLLGRWVEISGRLEKETSKDPDNLRELDVVALKMVPVMPPRPAATPTAARQSTTTPAPAAAPRPAPQAREPNTAPAPAAAPSPSVSASSPVEPHRSLPKTASNVPAIGLIALLLLAAGVVLRGFRLRHQA